MSLGKGVVKQHSSVDTKQRIPFYVKDTRGTIWASGIMYDEGNIQVLWRADIGHCGQQFDCIRHAFGLFPSAKVVELSVNPT